MLVRAILTIPLAAALNSAAYAQTPTDSKSQDSPNVTTMRIEVAADTPLEKYVEQVRTRCGSANVVIDGDVGTIKLPKALLPKVTCPVALQWVTSTAESRSRSLSLRIARVGQDPNAVYVYTYTRTPARIVAPEEHVVKTYYVAAIDSARPTDANDVVTAIREAFQKQSSQTKGTADYNNKTRTITVAGTRSDIVVADRVVEDMTQVSRLLATLPRMRAEIDRLQAQITELKRTTASRQ